MTDRNRSTVMRHASSSIWIRTLACAVVALTVAACDTPDRLTATEPVLASVGSQQARVDAFIAAQGKYCNDAIGLVCDVDGFYGVEYIYASCGAKCAAGMSADFAGVNRKWWDARNLAPYTAPLRSSGTLNESVQQDGRRRLVVNIRAENTFVSFFDANLTMLVGADFLEYPPFGGDAAYNPLLGEATLHADLLLPAGYVGYPDIIQALFDVNSGIEVRTASFTASVDGPLRVAYEGIPAGTMVRVSGMSRALLKLQRRQVPSRHLIATGYDPAARISVQVLR